MDLEQVGQSDLAQQRSVYEVHCVHLNPGSWPQPHQGLADVLIAGRRLGSGVLQFHRVSTASARPRPFLTMGTLRAAPLSKEKL